MSPTRGGGGYHTGYVIACITVACMCSIMDNGIKNFKDDHYRQVSLYSSALLTCWRWSTYV